MTEAHRIADSTAFKLIVPVMQFLLGAVIVGTFVDARNQLTSLQTQFAEYRTSQALQLQDTQYQKRTLEDHSNALRVLTASDQDHTFQLKAINEYLKAEATARRPRS